MTLGASREATTRCALVLDKDKRHRMWLSRIIGGLVGEVRCHEDLDTETNGVDLCLVNHDSFEESDLRRMLALVGTQTPVLMFSEKTQDYGGVLALFRTRQLTNLLAKNGTVDPDELIVTAQKILRGEIFGLAKYFPWGTEVYSSVARSSTEVPALVAATSAYATRLGVHPRLAVQFSVVVDEFLTNAIYNAPVDANRNSRFRHVSRKVDVTLDDGEQIVLDVACDGRRLGVAVRDPFGSLSGDAILAYLVKCFRRGNDQVDEKEGGAGVGLYVSFSALSQFVVNIADGRQTEVIGLIDVQGSFRDFAQKSKSFHVFVESSR